MESPPTLPEPFGPFTLLRLLGVGGMGSAYLARHPDSDLLLVVKRLHPALLRQSQIFKRFVHEAEVAVHVRHPNVAAVVAMGTIDKEPFLATEYVFGVAMSQIIERIETAATNPVPLDVGLALGLELARAIDGIHRARHLETSAPLGLIHRDVTARNVLVGFDGILRLIDFGLGKSVLADWQTAHQAVAGSPDYMPPEQARGGRVDARADVYSAAVAIWELLTGRKRIREDTVAARLKRAIAAEPEPLTLHRPDASREFEAILRQAMASDPRARTPTAAHLVGALQDELQRVNPRLTRADIIGWLDGACATLIAKERRALDDVKAFAAAVSGGAAEDRTRILAVRRGGFAADRAEPLQFYSMDDVAQKRNDLSSPLFVDATNTSSQYDAGRVSREGVAGHLALLRRFVERASLGIQHYADILRPSQLRHANRAERLFVIAGALAVALSFCVVVGVVLMRRIQGGRDTAVSDLMAAHDAVDARDAVDGRDAVDAHDAVDASDAIDGRDAYDVGAEASRRVERRASDRSTTAVSSSDRPVARPSPIAPLPARAPASARHEVPSGRSVPGGTESSPVLARDRESGRPRDVARRTHKSPGFRERKRVMIRRVRAMRRVRFDRKWQDSLTELSGRLSRSRDDRALDGIQRALDRLERL